MKSTKLLHDRTGRIVYVGTNAYVNGQVESGTYFGTPKLSQDMVITLLGVGGAQKHCQPSGS